MDRYVCGFLFDAEKKRVLLLKKSHPDWQQGKLNGVGGKVTPGEHVIEAMQREFTEETGIGSVLWQPFCRLTGADWSVQFFCASSDVMFESLDMPTEEFPVVRAICHIARWNCIPNLRWLIPMALSVLNHEDNASHFIVLEGGPNTPVWFKETSHGKI